jgi:hypothetical protein
MAEFNPATSQRRMHFLVTGSTTPQLLVGDGQRQAVVFVNESSTFGCRVGHSGSVASRGLYIPPLQSLTDTYSALDWWVIGSGTTVSGFIIT